MDDALSLLRLQMEWGADEALEIEPIDRLSAAVVPPPVAVRAALTSPAASQTRAAPADHAAAVAARADTPEALREAIASFDGCSLRDTASHLVWAEGNPLSTILLIGEPPGREEDRGGHPFAGPDGVLLDQMLSSIGLTRGELMLTPLLPWRPPGGRPPNANEMAVCLPFLHRLIVLVGPRRLVLFGGTAARALLPPALARRRQPPDWVECRVPGLGHAVPVLCLPSLMEMQKTPGLRRAAWGGLRRLRRTIDAG